MLLLGAMSAFGDKADIQLIRCNVRLSQGGLAQGQGGTLSPSPLFQANSPTSKWGGELPVHFPGTTLVHSAAADFGSTGLSASWAVFLGRADGLSLSRTD